MKQICILAEILLVILISFSCSEESNDHFTNTQIYPISNKLRPLLFAEGSYWIYSNLSDSTVDSIWITDIVKKEFDLPPSGPGTGSAGIYEYFEIYYTSSLNYDYKEQLFLHYISRNLVFNSYVYIADNEVEKTFKNIYIAEILDSAIVAGEKIDSVVKIEISQDEFIPEAMVYFYADSVGVVRKEKLLNNADKQIWELIDYNVNLCQPYSRTLHSSACCQ